MADRVVMYKCDDGGCGVLRIIQPAKYLKNLGYKVSLELLNTSHSIDPDTKLCVFQRDYVQPDTPQYWEWLKKQGIKIVYDLDDDIFDVPESNPNYTWFKRIDIRSRYEFYLRYADLVTVSTNYLKTRLENFNQNIVVLPNCIDFETWPTPVDSAHSKIRLGWAGSPTHHEDLMLIFPAIKNLMKRYNSLHLNFLGYCPQEYLDEFKSNLTYVEGGTYSLYQLKLAQLGIDIGFIPLVVNGLNRSKSPVKYLEFSSLKIPSVASLDSPYKNVIRDGENGLLANSLKEWEEKLDLLIRNKSQRKKIGSKAYDYCFEKFDIAKQIILWESAYKRVLDNQLTKEILGHPGVLTIPGTENPAYSDDYQLIMDQFNIAKLFVNNKEILITSARNPLGFNQLLQAGAKRLHVVDSDQEILDLVSQKYYQNHSFNFQFCNFDFAQNPALKSDFDIILSINDYANIIDKRKYLMRLQNLLKKFGTIIISFRSSDDTEKHQFLTLMKYFFKVTNIITLQEYIKPKDPKYTLVFASKY